MVFLPITTVMTAEEAANVIKVDECDRYDEEWTPPFDARDCVLLKTNEKFTDWYDSYDCLGEGKFGQVYRCVEKSTKLELAAKCIRLKREADIKQVEKEVSFMTRMRHKCIAQIYDAFVTSSTEVVLIMEIVQGGELFDRVVEEDYILTETAAAMIVYQICEAIRYIHSHNIIHLDLKPENIMCTTQTGNQIKLIDFGLAQYYDGEHDLLFMAGTPEFAAPEVIKFEPLDFHTDMWSVGVIVYILLSGESPFLGDNLALTYFNVERGLWEFCEEFDDNGISDEARDFIKKLLILDKSKRMLPAECLQHPWIQIHREKARQNALANRADESSPINTAKLRTYVKNKNFRRAVFAVLFVNSVIRMFKTLKEKKSEAGIVYVQTMLNAVKEQEANGEGPSAAPALLKAAMNAKRRKNAVENNAEQPEPSTSMLSTDEIDAKVQRLDSGLGEGSTKVSAVEGPDAPVMIHIPIETDIRTPQREPSPIPEASSKNELHVLDSKTSEHEMSSDEMTKKIKKKKTPSSKISSHDSALSPGSDPQVVIVGNNKNNFASTNNETKMPENNNALLGVTSSSTSAAVTTTTTTTATATSEEEGGTKPKKIVRKKKIAKPVLTLRDVEVPTMKTKKVKKKSTENILDTPPIIKNDESKNLMPESNKSSERFPPMENPETQPIQALIARRRPSTAKPGGLVGNLLGRFEQNLEFKPPMKFAVSGVVPIKRLASIPAGGLPQSSQNNPSLKTTQWASATDVVKVNGLPAKIEKIKSSESISANTYAAANNENKTKTEIPMEFERKVVSEKRTSIKNKNFKEEHSMMNDTTTESKKSNTNSCEVAIHSTTNIQESPEKISKTSSKALYAKEVKEVEKKKSENKTPEVLQLLAERKITATEKLGLNQSNSENGVKLSEKSLKLKDEEKTKTLVSMKSIKAEHVGGAIVVESKKLTEVIIDNGEKIESAKIERKQKISSKPPKPNNNSGSDVKKGTTTKSKNKSLDNLLDSSDDSKNKNKSSVVTFSKENLKHVIRKNEGEEERNFTLPRPPHKTKSAMNVIDSTTASTAFKYKTTKSHHNYDDDKSPTSSTANHRHSLELTPEKIEELQAKERDAYDFGNLRAQLERRVSGGPLNEYEEWKKAKADELRSSLHDSTNIKRAMRKWLSMDKANK